MNTSDPAIIYCRFINSVVNHQRLDHLEQFLATNVVEHMPEVTVGIEPARRRLARSLAAFPDLHLVIQDLVVDGDHLMARLTATGTHRCRLAGVERPATHLSVPVFEAWSVANGRCLERWLQVDRWALRRQLGLDPDRHSPGCSIGAVQSERV